MSLRALGESTAVLECKLPVSENLLNRKFKGAGPDRVWVLRDELQHEPKR